MTNPRLSALARFLIRLAITAVFLLPLLWLLSAALHPPGIPLPQTLRLWPDRLSLANFQRIWELLPLGRFTLNSLQTVGLAVPLTLLSSSWAGYAISQQSRPSQRRWVLLSLVVLMVPGIALWVARFFIYRQLGWLDSVWALVAPAWMGSSPFYVLMFYRACRRLPTPLYEAARLDGAGVWQTWRFVVMPLVRPTAVGVALLSFILYWSDFISPLLYLRRETNYTLPVALQLAQQLSRSDWPLLLATAVFTSAIPVLLFLLLQPYFARLE